MAPNMWPLSNPGGGTKLGGRNKYRFKGLKKDLVPYVMLMGKTSRSMKEMLGLAMTSFHVTPGMVWSLALNRWSSKGASGLARGSHIPKPSDESREKDNEVAKLRDDEYFFVICQV